MKESYKIIGSSTNKEYWLEQRRILGIGASESPAILGLSPYSTAFSVYADKMGLGEEKESDAMEWGKILELPVLMKLSDKTSRCIHDNKNLYQSKENEFMICTPDGFQFKENGKGRGVVQVKITSINVDKWKDEGIPPDINCQLQHEMYVTGLNWGTAVAFLRGWGLGWIDIERDNKFINEKLLPRCAIFWDHVKNKIPLGQEWIDGSDETKKAILDLYPQKEESSIELKGDLISTFKRRMELKEKVKDLENDLQELENIFRLSIGENAQGILPNGNIVTFKTHQKTIYNIPQEIKDKYASKISQRTLRFKPKKGE